MSALVSAAVRRLRTDLAADAAGRGADLVANSVRRVGTVAELRALPAPTRKTVIQLEGYWAEGDGGGGALVWMPTSNKADDGGMVFMPNSAPANGRWERGWDRSEAHVMWFGPRVDDATNDSPRVSAAINWLSGVGGGDLVFPRGILRCADPIEFKNRITYRGQGGSVFDNSGTMLRYVGATDAFRILNPQNASTAAFIKLEGLAFKSTTLAANQCLFYDLGSSIVQVKGCSFVSNRIGLGLDQSELWDVEECYFGGGTTADTTCIWLINGADKTPGNLPWFTNRITFKSNQFNGTIGTAIYDDGGVTHAYRDNNLNGFTNHYIITGVNGLVIDGGEYEISTGPSVIFGVTKRLLGAGAKTNVAKVTNTFVYNDQNQPAIATVAGALGSIEIDSNFYNLPGVTFSGLNVGADEVIARGNRQLGGGDTLAFINNHHDQIAHTPAWTASVAAPAIGDGTLAGQFSRKGREIKLKFRLQPGGTTNQGNGVWSFGLPKAANPNGIFDVGSVHIFKAGTSHYAGVAKLTAGGTTVRLYITSAAEVGSANPGLAVGDTVDVQITYTATDQI